MNVGGIADTASYTITIYKDGAEFDTVEGIDASSWTYDMTDVLATLNADANRGGNYTFTVTAIGKDAPLASFTSPESTASAAYTPNRDIDVAANLYFTASDDAGSDLMINWADAANTTGIAGYQVYVDGTAVGGQKTVNSEDTYNVAIPEAAVAGNHTVEVVSVPNTGYTQNSTSLSITKLETPVLGTMESMGKVYLTMETAGTQPLKYIVTKTNGATEETEVPYQSAVTKMEISSLDTASDYTVVAVGNGIASAPYELNSGATASTTISTLSTPDGFTLVDNADGSYKLDWNDSTPAAAELRNYELIVNGNTYYPADSAYTFAAGDLLDGANIVTVQAKADGLFTHDSAVAEVTVTKLVTPTNLTFK